MSTHTFCPECGWGVAVDEDGCCEICGNGATGKAVDREWKDVQRGITDVKADLLVNARLLARQTDRCNNLEADNARLRAENDLLADVARGACKLVLEVPAPATPAPSDPLAATAKPEEWAWAYKDHETAHGPFPTREAAIEDATRCCDAGDEVLVDTITWAHVCEYVDAEAYVEALEQHAFDDNYSFHDDQLFSIATSKEAAQEALCDWAKKHLTAARVWHTDGGNNAVTVKITYPATPALAREVE